MCEEFGCTPSVALREDAGTVLDIIDLRAYARAKEFIDRPATDEDAVARSGLPESLVRDVMANIERQVKERPGK